MPTQTVKRNFLPLVWQNAVALGRFLVGAFAFWKSEMQFWQQTAKENVDHCGKLYKCYFLRLEPYCGISLPVCDNEIHNLFLDDMVENFANCTHRLLKIVHNNNIPCAVRYTTACRRADFCSVQKGRYFQALPQKKRQTVSFKVVICPVFAS